MDHLHKIFVRRRDFKGRSSRDEFFAPMPALTIVLVLFYYAVFGIQTDGSVVSFGLVFILGIIIVFSIIPMLALNVRRFHDTGKSAWWCLINVIPYIGFLIYAYLVTRPSEPGENRYGSNPTEIEGSVDRVN